MAEMKRPRGRPPGDGIKADKATLDAMADLMFANAELERTAAIKQVLKADWHDRDLRRLRGKWNLRKEDLLADAAARAECKKAKASDHRAGGSSNLLATRNTHPFLASSDLSRYSTILAAARGIAESPSLNAIRLMMDSPSMRAIRAIVDSPSMRAMREFNASLAMQAMRDLSNNPTMQALAAFNRPLG